MSRDRTARLRMDYTGEPYSAAFQWYRSRGLFNGLVPDAGSPAQQRLEARLIKALARPAPFGLAPLVCAGTVFGLEGVSPDVDDLLLRPAGDLVAHVLARILPCAAAAGVAGVPGLRAQVSRRSGLTVGSIGAGAVVRVQPSRANSMAAAEEDLKEAAAFAVAAGLIPLWTSPELTESEIQARQGQVGQSTDDAVWSTALRRIGLFIDAVPDWSQRAPTPQEVAGPKPDRIRPRPVAGSGITGVIALTSGSGRGGTGCTTVGIALAGALARSGAAVGIFTGQDPGGFLARRARPQGAAADGWHDLMAIDGGGSVRAIAVPPDADTHAMLERARARFDVVILDAGNAFQYPQWVDLADVTVALVPYSRPHWSREKQLVDHRPENIRFLAWLDEAFHHFDRASGRRPAGPLARLLAFLDAEFLYYADARHDEGIPEVYDASDPQEVEEWWSEYAFLEQLGPDDYAGTPLEEETPLLDRWRADFLSFLDQEGSRRHGEVWAQAAAQWAARNKNRILNRTEQDAQAVEEFATAVEEDAIAQWGLEMWRAQFPVWEAAHGAGDDLLAPWEHLLETTTLPFDPRTVADYLRDELDDLSDQPTIVVLSRAESGLGTDRLTAVRDALMDDGYSGLVAFPHRPDFPGLLEEPERAAGRSGEAAGAGNRLAHAVAAALREVARPSQDCG